MLAIVCPGQGSQTPGFLAPWLELSGLRDSLSRWSEAIGVDLVTHGTVSDADTIRDTAVAQPLIVAAGLLTLDALFGDDPEGVGHAVADSADVVAGHSVGEFTAAVAAGVLTPLDAVSLVGVRGGAMAEASALVPTGMSAVLGGDPQEVLDTLARLDLTPANANGSGQVVAAGALEQLVALAEEPPAKARVIPLSVAGAFHTSYMEPAVEALRLAAADVTPGDPTITLLSNADGTAVTSGADALTRLVTQVSNPVRWDLCSDAMAERGVTGLLELAPAGTLTGLAKRGLKGVASVALKTPDDLDAARALVAAHR